MSIKSKAVLVAAVLFGSVSAAAATASAPETKEGLMLYNYGPVSVRSSAMGAFAQEVRPVRPFTASEKTWFDRAANPIY
jgi:hypothetical protein